jgi:hypothetical protein
MKKIITLVSTALLITVSSANAFWNTNTWNDGSYSDNGIFSYNPYNYGEPRWFTKEMANLFNEFDSDLNTKTPAQPHLHQIEKGSNVSDNGILSYNPHRYGEPRWVVKEMANLANEVNDGYDSGHSFPVMDNRTRF